MKNSALQILLLSLIVFAILFFINPGKAIFPTVLVAALLLIASFLQRATLYQTIQKSGTWRIVLGVSFLLFVVGRHVLQDWRENAPIVPVIIASVIALMSLNKYLQTRIESNRK
jgi:hypothetical protein